MRYFTWNLKFVLNILFMIVVHSFPGNWFTLLDFSNILWEERILSPQYLALNCELLSHKTSSCPSSYLNTTLITLHSHWRRFVQIYILKRFLFKKKTWKSEIVFCAQKIKNTRKILFPLKSYNTQNSTHYCMTTYGVLVILPVCCKFGKF